MQAGKAGVLKVNWKSYKSLYLGKRPLQHPAMNSGFNLPPIVPDRLSLPTPQRQLPRAPAWSGPVPGWEAHGAGGRRGEQQDRKPSAALRGCEKSMDSAFFLSTKSIIKACF